MWGETGGNATLGRAVASKCGVPFASPAGLHPGARVIAYGITSLMTSSPSRWRSLSFLLSCAAVVAVAGFGLLTTGCQQNDKALAAEDDSNPHFHAATLQVQQQNFDAAAKEYEAALRANPAVSEAHYELGLLYADHLSEPIAALYHFNQYLLDRPNGENSQQAQARLNAVSIGFAATVPNSPIQNAEVFAKLQKDNQDLQHALATSTQRVNDLLSKLAAAAAKQDGPADSSAPAVATAPALKDATAPAASETTAGAPAAVPVPAPAPVVAAPATAAPAAVGGEQEYVIVGGDTLWKIAKKFYPGHITEGINKIKAANTDILVEGKPLKIGTQIHIPAP